MDENRIVSIRSTVNARVGINSNELRIRREWLKEGAIQKIKFGDLEQMMYDPGIEYFFKSGELYIEDMDVKIALGLEEEGTKEPTNVVVLTDAQKKRYLTVAPIHDLKDILNKISLDHAKEIAYYAIKTGISDFQRCELLREKTGIDVSKAVVLERDSKRRETEGVK